MTPEKFATPLTKAEIASVIEFLDRPGREEEDLRDIVRRMAFQLHIEKERVKHLESILKNVKLFQGE